MELKIRVRIFKIIFIRWNNEKFGIATNTLVRWASRRTNVLIFFSFTNRLYHSNLSEDVICILFGSVVSRHFLFVFREEIERLATVQHIFFMLQNTIGNKAWSSSIERKVFALRGGVDEFCTL